MKPVGKNTLAIHLTQFGLSNDTNKCYRVLVKNGALSSEEIARRIGVLPNSVYRLTHALEKLSLITRLNTYPMKFQAVPPQIALTTLADNHIKKMETIKTQILPSVNTLDGNIPQTKLDILTGWKSMMDTYVKLAETATQEILIISIGESVPDEVKIANRDALERGVSMKFIVHTYNRKNEALLSSWVKMGIETRYYPESGYHLIVIDGKTCMLTTSNPDYPQERTTVFMHSEGLSRAMQQHFCALWAQSLPIKAV
jgi:sugar-specific transcriptional regulator TrmB